MDQARRQAYLDALGIRAWVRRDLATTRDTDSGNVPAEPKAEPVAAGPAVTESVATVRSPQGGFPGDALRAALKGELPAAKPEPPAVPVRPVPSREPSQAPVTVEVTDLDWSALAGTVAGCRACGLHETRTQTVFGVGSETARLMIIGEAPGADEDRQGEPFVGRAGQLLDAMLHAIGLARGEVYIANILKCRPPGNRNPATDEVVACQAYLERQIALLGPRLILSVGAVSAQNLLGTDLPVGKLRGRMHHHPSGVPVAVTYHPAYLLRRPEEKAKAWADLQQVARTLRAER